MAHFKPLRWAFYTGLGLITIDTFNHSIARLQTVRGPSMSPTLAPTYKETGDTEVILVLPVWRIPYLSHPQSQPASQTPQLPFRRGDIVTLTSPHKPGKESVKRIVGLPGDTVLRDVRRLGKQEQQGGVKSLELGLKPLPAVVKVPVGSVWLEGDNWRDTRDSNDYGAVSANLINGRVWGVVWPLARFGRVGENGREKVDSRTVVRKADKVPGIDEMAFT